MEFRRGASALRSSLASSRAGPVGLLRAVSEMVNPLVRLLPVRHHGLVLFLLYLLVRLPRSAAHIAHVAILLVVVFQILLWLALLAEHRILISVLFVHFQILLRLTLLAEHRILISVLFVHFQILLRLALLAENRILIPILEGVRPAALVLPVLGLASLTTLTTLAKLPIGRLLIAEVAVAGPLSGEQGGQF